MAVIQANQAEIEKITKSELSELDTFRKKFQGVILTPESPDWETTRMSLNKALKQQPKLIVLPSGNTGVQQAVKFATSNGLEIAVRGGGHSVSGASQTEGGLLIVMNRMTGVRVDKKKKEVWFQTGCLLRDIDLEVGRHGLAIVNGTASDTGCGLHIGGGSGYYARKEALSIDNMIEVEIVLSSGELLVCSKDENSDLFWGVCGAGSSFGVVTSMTVRAFDDRKPYYGNLTFSIDKLASLLELNQQFVNNWNVFTMVQAVIAPTGVPMVVYVFCYDGTDEEFDRDWAIIKAKVGDPLVGEVPKRTDYITHQSAFAEMTASFPWHIYNAYWTSSYVDHLTPEVISSFVDVCKSWYDTEMGKAAPLTFLMCEFWGGKISDIPITNNAFLHRKSNYLLGIFSGYLDPSQGPAVSDWSRKQMAHLRSLEGVRRVTYANFIDKEEDYEVIKAVYGGRYEKLQQLKDKYDPKNVFRKGFA